jgi:hypothetical protein
MKRIVLGILLVFSAVSLAAQTQQRQAAPELKAPSNGEEWLRLSSSEKLYWAVGYAQGYRDALDKIDVTSGPGTPCASLAARTERQTSTAGKVTGFELVSGLERFYSDPANAVIPIGSAIRIYLLQASGKDQTTIQELIDTARLLGSESTRRPASQR